MVCDASACGKKIAHWWAGDEKRTENTHSQRSISHVRRTTLKVPIPSQSQLRHLPAEDTPSYDNIDVLTVDTIVKWIVWLCFVCNHLWVAWSLGPLSHGEYKLSEDKTGFGVSGKIPNINFKSPSCQSFWDIRTLKIEHHHPFPFLWKKYFLRVILWCIL